MRRHRITKLTETVPLSPDAEAPVRSGFRLPADYYASPATDIKPIVPRWVPLGCGAAAALVLLLAFGAGAVVAHIGVGPLMEMIVGSMEDELRPMVAKVPQPERAELEQQLALLRENIRTERIPVAKLDPVIQDIKSVSADEKITIDEAKKLTGTLRQLNGEARPRPPARPRG
jgi:hypothetical protein